MVRTCMCLVWTMECPGTQSCQRGSRRCHTQGRNDHYESTPSMAQRPCSCPTGGATAACSLLRPSHTPRPYTVGHTPCRHCVPDTPHKGRTWPCSGSALHCSQPGSGKRKNKVCEDLSCTRLHLGTGRVDFSFRTVGLRNRTGRRTADGRRVMPGNVHRSDSAGWHRCSPQSRRSWSPCSPERQICSLFKGVKIIKICAKGNIFQFKEICI